MNTVSVIKKSNLHWHMNHSLFLFFTYEQFRSAPLSLSTSHFSTCPFPADAIWGTVPSSSRGGGSGDTRRQHTAAPPHTAPHATPHAAARWCGVMMWWCDGGVIWWCDAMILMWWYDVYMVCVDMLCYAMWYDVKDRRKNAW